MSRPTYLLLAVLLLAGSAHAQTYRWIDPTSGRTMITDTPPPGRIKPISKTTSGDPDETALPYAVRQAAANFPVTLYIGQECATECKNARDLLNRRGVPFSEKVLRQKEDFDELKALVGDAFVPSLKVGKQTVRGFQAEAYGSALDMAGYPSQALPGRKPAGSPAK